MTDDRYEWISSGGCERCDSMGQRLYANAPERPHPNCSCEIIDHHADDKPCRDEDVRYTLEHTDNRHSPAPNDPDDSFTMLFDYEIFCPTGITLTGTIEIERTYAELGSMDVEDFFLDAYDEALQQVDEKAGADCPSCPSQEPSLVA